MKLSEIIAMVEDWLEWHTDGYSIITAEKDRGVWNIVFNEIGENRFSTLKYNIRKNRIYNSNGDDILSIGRIANDISSEWQEWYDEFEKKWRYGDER